jgi:hypothetical protein
VAALRECGAEQLGRHAVLAGEPVERAVGGVGDLDGSLPARQRLLLKDGCKRRVRNRRTSCEVRNGTPLDDLLQAARIGLSEFGKPVRFSELGRTSIFRTSENRFIRRISHLEALPERRH